MKPNELRIGNWIQFRYTETPVRITLGDFVREYNDEHLEDYEPIPLTEEWLLKFGFENYSMNLDEDGFTHVDVSFLSGGVEVYINDMIYPHIKHVHQLQNLYFALTGEELQTDESDKKVN